MKTYNIDTLSFLNIFVPKKYIKKDADNVNYSIHIRQLLFELGAQNCIYKFDAYKNYTYFWLHLDDFRRTVIVKRTQFNFHFIKQNVHIIFTFKKYKTS